ncbi:MAG: O-antigen ligase family protein [Candidatus Magasanikiibacteriota bacterium]
MFDWRKQLSLQSILEFLTKLFLFLLPWQTIWIIREQYLGGVKMEYGTTGFYGTELLLWVTVVLFMVWFVKRNKELGIRNKFMLTRDRVFVFSVLLFTVYCLLSSMWAFDKGLAWQQGLRIMEMFLLFFIIFLGPLNFLQTAKWFVFGAIPVAVLGIGQFLLQETFTSKWLGLVAHPVWEAGTSIIQSDSIGRWLRAYGSFSHPNVFGGYLVIIIVTLLYCYIVKIGEQRRIFINLLFFILYPLFLTALFFTFSRSAWLSFFIILLSFIVIAIKQYFKNLKQSFIIYHLSFIIIILFSILFFPLIQTRVFSQSISEVRSVTERVSGYHEAWKIFKQDPLLGVGAGNYTLSLYRLDKWQPGWVYQPVHNVGLLVLSELGLVGVSLFFFVIGSFVYLIIKDKDGRNKILFIIPYFLFLIPLLIFDHYLYSSYTGLMMFGLFWSLWAKYSTQSLPR